MFSRQSKFIVASGFTTLLLIMVAVTTIGYSHMVGSTARMEAIVRSQNTKINLVISMYSAVRERAVLLFGMVHAATAFERDPTFVRFTDLAAKYVVARDELNQMVDDPAEKALVDEITNDVVTASPLQIQVTGLLLDGKLREAGELLRKKAMPAQDVVLRRLNDLLDFEQSASYKGIALAQDDFEKTLGLLVVLIIVAVVIGAAIALIVIAKISQAGDILFADAALQSIAESVIILDTGGRMLYLNNKALDLMECRRPELVGRRLKDVIACMPDLDAIREASGEQGSTPASRRGECMFKSRSGKERDLEYSISAIQSRSNQTVGLVIAVRDITERHAMEQQILKSRERLSLVVRGTNDGIWDYNLETGEIYFSPRWKSMLGYADDEIKDTFSAWQELIHPDDLGKALIAWTDCMTGAVDCFSVEMRMRSAAGDWRWIECRGLAQLNDAMKPVRLAGSHTDITERKNAENALFSAKEHAEVTLQSIGEAVITLDKQGLVTYMNPVAETLSDWPVQEAVGTSFQHDFQTLRRGRPRSGRRSGAALREVPRFSDEIRPSDHGEPQRNRVRRRADHGPDPGQKRRRYRRCHRSAQRQQGTRAAAPTVMAGDARQPDRARQSLRFRAAARRSVEGRSGRQTTNMHCCTWISISSKSSTTPADTSRATSCCASSGPSCSTVSAAPTRSHVLAATSSASCCRTAR